MTDLSPAAQAVFDAVKVYWEHCPANDQQYYIACSIRAAANQVVPQRRKPLYADSDEESAWSAQQDTREELLAIADELEGVKYGTYRCDLEGK